MTNNRDGCAILNAVVASPEDDLLRLVYADWLDDHGNPTRAEFIRVQLLLARAAKADGRPEDGMRRLGWKMAMCRERKTLAAVIGDPSHHDDECESCLQRRELELFDIVADQLADESGIRFDGSRSHWLRCDGHDGKPFRGGVEMVVRRGFIEAVAMPLEAFEEHAAALFARCPVTDVRLIDVRPRADEPGQPWGPTLYRRESYRHHGTPDEGFIPASIFDRLAAGNYCSEGEASPRRSYAGGEMRSDLSAACVAYGREQAAKSRQGEAAAAK